MRCREFESGGVQCSGPLDEPHNHYVLPEHMNIMANEYWPQLQLGQCPACFEPLTGGDNMSGVKCTSCSYWYCA